MTEGPADQRVRDLARRWRDDDPDPDTAAQVDRLLEHDDVDALHAAFDRPLQFGTAGLRGPLGPGPAAMNRAVVRRTASAIASWLGDHAAEGPVVVGRDARHGSEVFARDVAGVLAASGRAVVLSGGPVPTPLTAFAVRHLSAAAGVMVTASHNPPRDNGLKLYGGDGAQIVAPVDAEIAARIDAITSIGDIPVDDPDDSPLVGAFDDALVAAYLDGVASLCSGGGSPVTVAYTPMHGVGLDLVRRAFDRCGYPPPVAVAEQAEPDPDFPTVEFPNPEEPGAMDLVLDLARDIGADLVLANDPDADRLAVAVPAVGPDAGTGADGWRVLTGDELGVLLADHLLARTSGERLVVNTVVSSSMLARVAESHGVAHVETLTGFKWMAKAALERPERLVLAYEEALGYCVADLVRDKDGVSAAVVAVEVAGALAAEGSSIPERLAELAVRHGLHRTRQRSVRFSGAEAAESMAAAVDRLRSSPPTTMAGRPVTEVEDLAEGRRLPPTDGVVLRADGLRLVVRPSGTEPKLKLYVQAVRPVASTDDVPTQRRSADETIDRLLDEILAVLAPT